MLGFRLRGARVGMSPYFSAHDTEWPSRIPVGAHHAGDSWATNAKMACSQFDGQMKQLLALFNGNRSFAFHGVLLCHGDGMAEKRVLGAW